MERVRWGLLSTAHINRRLIPIIQNSPRGELVAVASRDHKKAKEYASRWRIPQAFGSYQAMLDSGAIDAVYISLPNHLHAEWTIRALEAGVHVLCEKPFASTLDDVDQMIATAQHTGRVLAEAFMYRHHPQTKIVGEWVHNGRLGEISLVRSIFNFLLKDRLDIRLVPEYGGGSLWDVGVYPISFAQFIFGSAPETVVGQEWVGDSGVDETFAGVMQYPNGGLAEVSSSFRSEFYTHAEIIGSEGRLTLNRPFTMLDQDRHLIFYPNQGAPVEIEVPEEELYQGEVEDMHSAILDETAPYLTLDETRNHVRTALALYQAAEIGELVPLA